MEVSDQPSTSAHDPVTFTSNLKEIKCQDLEEKKKIFESKSPAEIVDKQIYPISSIISAPSTSIINPSLINTISKPESNIFDWQRYLPLPVENQDGYIPSVDKTYSSEFMPHKDRSRSRSVSQHGSRSRSSSHRKSSRLKSAFHKNMPRSRSASQNRSRSSSSSSSHKRSRSSKNKISISSEEHSNHLSQKKYHKRRSRSRSSSHKRRSRSRSSSHKRRSRSRRSSHKRGSSSAKNKEPISCEKESRSRVQYCSKKSGSPSPDKQISSLELTTYKKSRSKGLSPNGKPNSMSENFTLSPVSKILSTDTLKKESFSSNSKFYTDSDDRKLIGDHNSEEYDIALKQMKGHFDEEYLSYEKFPKLHPNYQSYYKSFSEIYDVQGRDNSKQCKKDLWLKFWTTKFCDIKKSEWKIKLKSLDMKFKDKIADTNLNSKPILVSNKKEISSYSFNAAINMFEKLTDSIGFLGITLKAMISSYRKLSPNSKEAYSMFTESENVAFVNMVLQKVETMKLSATSDTLEMCEKASKWIPKLLDEAKCRVKLFEQSCTSIDLEAIAKASMGKSNSFITDMINAVLVSKGVQNPTFNYINELFLKVCEIHFSLATANR